MLVYRMCRTPRSSPRPFSNSDLAREMKRKRASQRTTKEGWKLRGRENIPSDFSPKPFLEPLRESEHRPDPPK